MALHDMKGLRGRTTEKEDAQGMGQKEESSLMKRLASLRDKLKLGPHHKMERFMVMLGGTLSLLLVFSVLSFTIYRADVVRSVSAQAVYTEDFEFSLSGEQMAVEGVYGNEERTDVMVLLQIKNPEGMSADANNYELFITGERKELSYKPDVSFSLFGATGYGIVRFQHEEPIPKEIVDITIRSNAELSEQKDRREGDDSEDGSFDTYDQGRFYVNPGADGVKEMDWMKAGETDPATLYTALVADALDQEIRKEIKGATEELRQLLNREKEYTNRLVSAGYEPPKTPWFIEGDYVNDDGVFISAQDLAGAFSFDYHTKTIRDGYINQVMTGFTSFDDLMEEHVELEASSKEERVDRIETLVKKDGAELDLAAISTGTSPSAHVAVKDSAESLTATWRTYLGVKSELQRDLMRDLLLLDADVQSQTSSYSDQSGEDVVTFY